ncbi:MAG: SDR family oxidoreductase [Anaerolineales bacterium]|nr:SDR family oxidoreductase [Anaerolineales bacterium]
MTSLEQVQALWDAAQAKFGRVDVWINNAGLAHSDVPFWEQPASVMHDVVSVNVLGVMHGSKVAVLGMAAQGSGAIYNFEGFGSNGRTRFGLGVYGSTKAAERFFTRSLALDVKTKGLPVQIGSISPGIVITDLVTGQYAGREQEFTRARRVFNILGDKVETVTPFIADKVLAGETNIQWLTGAKVMWRFATAGFSKRQIV